MQCDICGEYCNKWDTESKLVPASKMKEAISSGFNPYKLDMSHGDMIVQDLFKIDISKDSIFSIWKKKAMSDISDWLICSKCYLVLKNYFDEPKLQLEKSREISRSNENHSSYYESDYTKMEMYENKKINKLFKKKDISGLIKLLENKKSIIRAESIKALGELLISKQQFSSIEGTAFNALISRLSDADKDIKKIANDVVIKISKANPNNLFVRMLINKIEDKIKEAENTKMNTCPICHYRSYNCNLCPKCGQKL